MDNYKIGDKVKLKYSLPTPVFKKGNVCYISKIIKDNPVFDYEIEKKIGRNYVRTAVSERDIGD